MPYSGGAGILTTISSGAQSIVLQAASSQYLQRTWSQAPSSNFIATMAFWFKRLSVQSAFVNFYDGGIWSAAGSGADVRFPNTDTFQFDQFDGATAPDNQISTSTYTDTTTWHHACLAFDFTQATATDRRHIYIDGVEITYGTDVIAAQNSNTQLCVNGLTSYIGNSVANPTRFIDAKLAYFYFVDGTQLTPSSFTTGTGAGTIHPIPFSPTGVSAFFLNFAGNANDSSGQGNHWTQNNSPTFSADVPT